jgi:hypothetical protein
MLHLSRSELYDRIGLYLARGFQNSQLTFEFCDAVVNDLHSVITFADEARPALFWKVYLACHQRCNRCPLNLANRMCCSAPFTTITEPSAMRKGYIFWRCTHRIDKVIDNQI